MALGFPLSLLYILLIVSTNSCSAVVNFSSHGNFGAGKDSSGYSEKARHSQRDGVKKQYFCGVPHS